MDSRLELHHQADCVCMLLGLHSRPMPFGLEERRVEIIPNYFILIIDYVNWSSQKNKRKKKKCFHVKNSTRPDDQTIFNIKECLQSQIALRYY